MNETKQISTLSAYKHYATSAGFWENRAKMLQSELDDALAIVEELKAQLAAIQEATEKDA